MQYPSDRPRIRLLPALAGILVVALSGFSCGVAPPGAAAARPAVWACGESLKVSPGLAPQEKNSVWSAGDRTIRLYGARQEYVGFQVVVRAGTDPLRDVQVRLSPLKSAGGKE